MFHKFLIEYSGRDISLSQHTRLVDNIERLGWFSRENKTEGYNMFQSPDGTKTIYIFKKPDKIVAGWLGTEDFRNPEAIIKWVNERERKEDG